MQRPEACQLRIFTYLHIPRSPIGVSRFPLRPCDDASEKMRCFDSRRKEKPQFDDTYLIPLARTKFWDAGRCECLFAVRFFNILQGDASQSCCWTLALLLFRSSLFSALLVCNKTPLTDDTNSTDQPRAK